MHGRSRATALELALIRDRAHRELYDFFTRIVTTLRQEPVATAPGRREARRLLALVDGFGLHLLHQHDNEVIEIVRDELKRIHAGVALRP